MANVHKDFHGALSFGIQFLDEQYGMAGLEEFFTRAAKAVYAQLIKNLRERGLEALKEHWDTVFGLEDGDFETRYEDGVLVLDVRTCPAVHHMRANNYRVADHFCEHTRIVNEAICAGAGYACSVEYDQEAGRCVQRFWRAGA
ncbi:MAG TPA: hypothetical protein PKY01_18170 [Candidatus Hydrogenedentes bacterium]|nr:hypothetical protein [Candidatus Hydrogenedentota bacterium]HQH54360.1 hypothetical protein [Candidatus Hydrogenedentota bacterium]HQM50158.1 hypothetical protein [Candidatus Hydrogenedentota bacterium]